MKIKIILFFFSMAFIYNAIGQDETRKPINSGFVFIDGRYIEPPYNVDIINNTIFINNIQAYKTYKEIIKPIIPEIKEDPGLPPDNIQTWKDYINYKSLNSKYSFNSEKIIYYYSKYSPEKAKSEMRKFLLNLPFVINGSSTKDGYITFQRSSGEVCPYSWKKFADEIINQNNKSGVDKKDEWKSVLIDQQKRNINKLNAGGTVLWSNTKELVSLHFVGDSASSVLLFNELVQLTKIKNFNSDTVSQKLYNIGLLSGSEYEGKVFKDFINVFTYSSNFTKRLDELRNYYLSKYGSEWKNTIMKNKVILPNNESPNLKSNPKSGSINYSPDRNDFFYICPYVWDPVFTNYSDEIDYVQNEILLYGYPTTNIVIDEYDDDIAIPINTWKNLSAGVLFISAHGEEIAFQGMIIADFINESNADSYKSGEVNLYKYEYTGAGGFQRFLIYADNNFFNTYTHDRLTNEKTIVLLGVCNGLDVSYLIGGGAVFGYNTTTTYSANKSDFTRILRHMNGNQESGTVRNAQDAYNNVVNWNGMHLEPPTANITLCPATKSYFPHNGDIVPVNYPDGGYIELDTWCDPLNTPVSDAISFVTSGVTITNVAWDNNTITNKINFHWNGQGTVTVNINSSAFHSIGIGGDYNGYHSLDFDPSIFPCENGSYTFTTSSTALSPIANFSFVTQSAQSPDYTVVFTDMSQYAPTSWSWNFGDGSPSNQQNPSHSYFNYGSYTVSLTVSNQWGSNSISKLITINSNNTTEPLDVSCNVNSTVAYVNQPIESNCQIWSGTPPFSYEFRYIVNNDIISSQIFNNEFSFTKNAYVTLSSTPTSAKLFWNVTDANNNNESCYDLIDVIANNDTDVPIIADFTWAENCDYVVDVNNPVTFVDMSYSTDPVSCPIAYWEWAFDWDTNADDCYWYNSASNPCHWDLAYTSYRSTVSHQYSTIGIKTIRLLTSSWLDPNSTGGHNVPDGNCRKRNYKWGGIYVINCDYTSNYMHLNYFEGFLGAIRNNNWNPNYIYGGTFNINGNANNYLNSNNIVISACKEIVVTGDIEFIASGEHELILEINDNECLQNSTINFVNNEEENNENSKIINNDIDSIYSFPNPFFSEIEINATSNLILSIKLIDISGKVIMEEKFDSPINYWKLNTVYLISGVYLLEVDGLIDKYTKKIIKTLNTL